MGGKVLQNGRRGKRNKRPAPVWLLDIDHLALYFTVAQTMRTPMTARDSCRMMLPPCRMLLVLLAIFPWSAFAAPLPESVDVSRSPGRP